MPNGRCRMHGGASTGPRTAEGLERSRKARWKTGKYSVEAKEANRQGRAAEWFLEVTGILPLGRRRVRAPSRQSWAAFVKLREL